MSNWHFSANPSPCSRYQPIRMYSPSVPPYADSEGLCMYIILNGKVSVLVRANNDTMICVKYLESGDFFGELALVNKKPRYARLYRAATIRTVADCDFAVIYKKDYDAIIRKSQEDYISKITEFFRCIPLFKNWTKVALSKLQHNFELKAYKKGQIIYSEGEKAKNIFIVKEGEVEVYSKLDIFCNKGYQS